MHQDQIVMLRSARAYYIAGTTYQNTWYTYISC